MAIRATLRNAQSPPKMKLGFGIRKWPPKSMRSFHENGKRFSQQGQRVRVFTRVFRRLPSSIHRGAYEFSVAEFRRRKCSLGTRRANTDRRIALHCAQLNARKTPTTRNACSSLKTESVFRLQTAVGYVCGKKRPFEAGRTYGPEEPVSRVSLVCLSCVSRVSPVCLSCVSRA